MSSKDQLIADCIVAMQAVGNKHGYGVISQETLNEVVKAYIAEYKAPEKPFGSPASALDDLFLDSFAETIRKNQENKKRMEYERGAGNVRTIRSYRLKDKKDK